MSRQIGYFADDDVHDFPELNKCPDCETFFADACCPLCGKLCPEEYRSGNRKPVKQKKRRRSSSNGRVRFVPWYHTAPFVIAMLIIQPIIGLILAWTTDWRRAWKIVATVVAVFRSAGGLILASFFGTMLGLFFGFTQPLPPVEEMTPAEYMGYCEAVDPQTLHDRSDEYYFSDVKLNVTVREVLTKRADFPEETNLTYYLCEARAGEVTYTFLLRDWRMASNAAIGVGDAFTAYGAVTADNILHLAGGGTKYGVCMEMYYAVAK